jgi:hypothetical protein
MKKIMIAAAAALALPAAAFAAEEGMKYGADHSNMNYTFGEFSYVDADQADGFGLEGSYQFNEKMFGFASYESLGDDFFDQTLLSFGVGSSMALNEKFDLYGKLAILSGEVEVEFCNPFTGDCDGVTDDDTGFGFEVGVRGEVVEKVEVFGNLQYASIFDGDTGFEIGGRYWFQENLGVSLALWDMWETDGFTLAARYEF